MNLTQLRQAVYFQTGLDEDDGLITPTWVNAAINRAIHAYSAEGTWPWLQYSEIILPTDGVDSYVPGAVAAGICASGSASLRIVIGRIGGGRRGFGHRHVEIPCVRPRVRCARA